MAFVILQTEAVQKWKERETDFAKELIQFVKGKLPGFACPEWVECVSELPKTSYVPRSCSYHSMLTTKTVQARYKRLYFDNEPPNFDMYTADMCLWNG